MAAPDPALSPAVSLPPACQDFIARFGLRFPIVQAPTGSISGPELAAAVCQAGAMGAMALTWADPSVAAEQVRAVLSQINSPPDSQVDRPPTPREYSQAWGSQPPDPQAWGSNAMAGHERTPGGKGVFLVNYALARPPRSLAAALEAGAPLVSFSWGDPAEFVPLVRSFGAKLAIQVTTAEGARRAVQHAPDFLVCQGVEAGGHVQATRDLRVVLADVLAAAEGIPVVAAGGIGDGAAIARALSMGASAAMLGTRFVATLESRAHPEYKRLLVQSEAAETALTVCFDGGWPYAPHRVLRNATLEGWEAAGCPPVGQRPGEGDVLGANAAGAPILRYEDTAPRTGFQGDIAAMCCYAGISCSAIHDLPSARDLVPRLWDEALAAFVANSA